MTVSAKAPQIERLYGARKAPAVEPATLRALVTGATGFIGSHLVDALLERGAFVRALARNAVKARSLPRAVQRCMGSLGDRDLPEGLTDDVDVVFHLGAAIGGGWADHERVTVEGTRRLLHQCRAAGVKRFVHVSSIMAHEMRHLRDGDVVSPNAPLAGADSPLGSYARGKADAERTVRAFCERYGMGYTIVRPGLVYGPGHIFFEHLGREMRGTFVGVGRRDLLLPLVSIESVVDALLRIAAEPQANGKAYFIVDQDVPRSEYIDILAQELGMRYRQRNIPLWMMKTLASGFQIGKRVTRLKKIPDVTVAKVRARGLSLRYDTGSLRRDTGWSPAVSVREGVRGALGAQPRERTGPVRVGIIGAGNVARMHLNALRRISGVKIVGILDSAAGRAAALADEATIDAAYEDADAFYTEAQPDVVHILTPPATHCEAAMAALERGVNVLCEKPLALTVEECRRMTEAARANNAVCCANHNYLLDERVAAARRMIEAGGIGEVRHVDVFWGFDVRRLKHFSATDRSHWAYQLPGGLLEDLAPHPLSIIVALLEREARVVHSSVRNSGRIAPGIDEELRIALEGGNVSANLAISLVTRPDDFTVAIYGTEATIRLDLQDMLIHASRLGKGPKAIARGLKVGRANLHGLKQLALNPLMLAAGRALPPADPLPLLRAFYSSLQNGSQPPVSTADAAKVVEIIRTIWPAAEIENRGQRTEDRGHRSKIGQQPRRASDF